jgi:hypothetical protein
MIARLFGAVFTPKYPRGYTGRHRAGEASSRTRSTITLERGEPQI